jgi:hypothetical protein
VVYSRKIDGQTLTFGISGRLYKSNVLLYDHQSESLWSQLMNTAVSGPQAGKPLTALPSARVSWKKWKRLHPETMVLSDDTGHTRDYRTDPYEGYYRAGGLMFPVGAVRTDYPAKQRILGIEVDGAAKAYALDDLAKQFGVLEDRIGGSTVQIEVSDQGEVTAVLDGSGRHLPHVFVFWFAWQAFNPETEVYAF